MVVDLLANEGFGLSDFTWWSLVQEATMIAYTRNLKYNIEYRFR